MSRLWRWLLVVVALTAATALPVPDETDTSAKLLGSSVVTSVSVVMGQEDGASEKPDTRKASESDPPPSTVDMLKPDGFQFYTVDEKGQLITRQMTDSEIQSIIAAGGGPFPVETQDHQKTGDNAMGEMKVADVVQNVKKVLKDELNKPVSAMGTVPTIPGHANDEWSSILPSILGGEADSAPVTMPEAEDEMIKQNVSMVEHPAGAESSLDKMPVPETPGVKPQESESTGADKPKPNEDETKKDEMVKIEQNPQPESQEPTKTEQTPVKSPLETSERPMIQVPVITADSVQSTMEDSAVEAEKPVYQILNTISAEEVKDKDGQTPEEAKPADKEPEKTETVAIPEKESSSGISPVTEKTEAKKPEVVEDLPTVETIVEMDVSSTFIPSGQESDKTEASSSSSSTLKETEDVKPVTPAITLEAPVRPETMEVVPEVKPEKDNNSEKKPAVVEEAPATPAPLTESTASEEAIVEKEVSEMVNFIPESISSIVDELVSDSSNSLSGTEASVGDNDSKKSEGDESTKLEDSDKKADGSDANATATIISDDQKPATETEPVFEMLAPISPDSDVTKQTAETSASSGIAENKPEVEQQTETSAQSESPQSMMPVIEATASATEKNEGTTQKTVEKKPETMLTELADSVSSMISQVSEVMPSMVPIPQKTETSEAPVKRVEDGIKTQEASTVMSIPSEEAKKPLAPNADLPSKGETTMLGGKEPEVVMVEIKSPEPTMTSSISDTAETMNISAQVSTEPITETSDTVVMDKIGATEVKTTSDVQKTETPAPEMEKTEQTVATPADSEASKISGPGSDQGSVKPEETVMPKPEETVVSKPEETVALKPEDSKPEETVMPKPEDSKPEETMVSKPEDSEPEKTKDETKTEENVPAAEAPIVRIDITEVKPTDSDVKNDGSTESSVVRIQLTNTVSAINQMIDSGSEVVPVVEVEDISLPEKTILEASSPQSIGSGLIAGTEPSNVVDKETSEDLPQLETAASASSEIVEDPKPTASTESDTKTESTPDADKPQPEVEKEKVPEAEVTQATTQDKPPANNEEDDKLEVVKATEASVESKPEKPSETEIQKDVAENEAHPVETMVKIDAPVPANEKIESPVKSEDQEKPTQSSEKIAEPVKVVSDGKVEEAVQETPMTVPAEVVVSTTVEVEPTKASVDMIKDEPVKSEEKPEETNTKLTSESVPSLEKKPEEADGAATKITESPIESNEKLVPVQLASPTATQQEILPEASTLAPASGDEKIEGSGSQKETEAPTTAQTNSEIQKTESTKKEPDVKNEVAAQVESADVSQTVKETSDSVAKPEMVMIEPPKTPSTENLPEKKIPVSTSPEQIDVKESSAQGGPDKDQTSVPLVRIDVSPEKNQTEISTTKIEEISDDKRTEKPPETPAPTEANTSSPDESLKKTDKPKEDSTMETSSASSKVPVEAVVEETKVQMPTAEEPEVFVKPTEESIKETVSVVESKVPEVNGAVEVTPANPIATKIDNGETAKPVIRIDNTPSNEQVKTQEIRIQVNDTAVLVTKQKIHNKPEDDVKKFLPTNIPDFVINKYEASSKTPEKIESTSQQSEESQVPSQMPEKIQDAQKVEVPSQKPEKTELPSQKPEEIKVPNQKPEKIEVPSQMPEKMEVPSQMPEKTEVPSQMPEKMEVPSQKPEKIEVPSQKPEKTEVPIQMPEKMEVPSQKPEKMEVPSQMPEKTEVPSQMPVKMEVPSQMPEKIEVPSQKPEKTEVPSQKPEKMEVPSQMPEKTEVPSQMPVKMEVPSQMPEKIEVPSQKPEKTEVPSQKPEKMEVPSQMPEKTEVPSQMPEKMEVPSQMPEKTEVPSQMPEKMEVPSQKPEKTEVPSQKPEKIEASSQKLEKIAVPSQEPEKIEVSSKKPEKIEVSSQKFEKIEVPSQKPEKIEVPSQKPDNIEVPSQKPEKIEIPSQKLEKTEVPSQPTKTQSVKPEKVEVLNQSTKTPVVEKPAKVTTADKTTLKQGDEKVKTESTSDQKKPLVDPYVKLGENKPEKKPSESNAAKLPMPVNKKPSNTEPSKDTADKWTLIPQSESNPVIKPQAKPQAEAPSSTIKNEEVSVPLEAHKSAVSLAESTRDQDEDISSFAKLCNELAFSFWIAANKGLSTGRSLALSPFGMTSMLAMVFLGARGPTSGQMNDILKLDDVVTFNPHLVFQNVSDSVNLARGQGIANAAFVRELFADRIKAGRLLPFYKERAQQFYDGHVEEVNFATISDLVRRRTNLLIRRQTGGRIRDFVKGNVMPLRSPLAALSANVFQTDCTGASSEGRDGEMYFAVLPAVRQRKLVPVPATVWRSGVLAGYEPGLDATVISLGGVGNLVSTIFVLPGQQGLAAPGDSLDHLERRLLDGAFTNGVWDRLIKVLIPRMGLEVQVPKFSHRSVVNATAALKRMGLDDLFSRHADLKGINGVGNDLHLADMLQINLFSTCGDEVITGGRHHVEIYPASPLRGARIEKKAMEIEEHEELMEEEKAAEMTEEEEEARSRRSLKVGEYLTKRSTSLAAEKQLIDDDREDEERSQRSSSNKELLQLSKGKQNERPLLKLDRPFLYFVRHNPTGMILHMGRFNPRLMP